MFFWHIGLSISFFRYVFKDFTADLRFLIVGIIIPEIIYLSLNLINISGIYPELGHTLLFAIFSLFLVMIFTKRDTQLRRNSLLVSIGIFFHLLFDFMWLRQEVLFFPLQFQDTERLTFNIGVLFIQEVIGLTYLIPKLNSQDKLKRFLSEGII
tara:strand:- start:315 stop:776 length:462 start_codon:yes stop_codon:yes gene_type:complete